MRLKNTHNIFFLVLSSLFPILAFGATGPGALLTYEGILTNSSDQPITSLTQPVTFQIIYSDSSETSCVVYEETQSFAPGSQGEFSVAVGTGVRTDLTNNTLEAIFAKSGFLCNNGASPRTPVLSGSPTHSLRIIVEGSALSPDVAVTNVPFSIHASRAGDADKLGGKIATDFLTFVGLPSCGAETFLTWNGSSLTCAAVTGALGGTVTNVTSTSSYLSVANGSSIPELTVNVGTTAGTLAAGDDPRFSGSIQSGGAAGGVLSGTYPNPGLANNSVSTANINDSAITTVKLFANPGVNRLVGTDATTGASLAPINCSTGQLLVWAVASGWQCTDQSSMAVGSASLAASATNFTGSLAGDVSGTQGVTSVNKIKGVPVDFSTAPVNGQVLKYNGTSWAPAADAGGGGGVTSVTASAPLSSSGGANPDISISQATSSSNGYLTSTDWNAFNNKQAALGFTPLNPAGIAGGQTLNGGTAANNNLTLDSTSDVAKGYVLLNPSGGNVGIGTITPAQKLSVMGTIESTSGGFKFPDGSVQTTAAAGGGSSQWTTSVNDIYYNTGKVGIGTTTPAQMLEVSGNIKTASVYTAAITNDSFSGSTSGQISLPQPGGSAGGGDVQITGGTAGSFSRQGSKISLTGGRDGTGDAGIQFKLGQNTASSTFTFYDSASNPLMTVTSGGSVGIGTTNPATKLDVVGAVRFGPDATTCLPAIAGAQRYNAGNMEYCNGSNWLAFATGASGVSSVTADAPLASSGGTTPIITISQANGTTNGYLSSADWNTFNNKMAGGTLSISNGGTGATTPSAARTNLELGTVATLNTGSAAGNVPVLGTGGLTANSMCTADGTGSGVICTSTIPAGSQWSNSGGNIYFNGNVGIGNSSPVGKLDVDGDVWIRNSIGLGQIVTLGPNGAKLVLRNTTSPAAPDVNLGALIFSSDTAAPAAIESFSSEPHGASRGTYMRFLTTSNGQNIPQERMRIDSDGWVGIGTQPFGTLSIKDSGGPPSFNLSTADYVVGTPGGTGLGISLVSNGGITSGTIQVSDPMANTRPLSLQPFGGNVGIGTNSPEYDLDLKRSASATKPTIAVRNYGTGTSPRVLLTNSRGSAAAPVSISNGDLLGGIDFSGQTDGVSNVKGAGIMAGASANWSATSTPSFLSFHTASFSGAPMERVRITENGNVGIGVTNPSYFLHVNGSVAGSGAYVNLSDARLKRNVVIIKNALEKIYAVRGVTFDWDKSVHPDLNLGNREEMGVIAQEVERIFPDAVSENPANGIKSVAYSMLIAPLIEAVKEVRNWLLNHDVEISTLKSENGQLKQENLAIKNYLCGKDPNAPFCK